MLDTAGKSAGSLTDVMERSRLTSFVERAKAAGLIAGLAGSLRIGDIGPLAALKPGILGFRGALCTGGRTGVLDAGKVLHVRQAIDAAANDDVTKRSVA